MTQEEAIRALQGTPIPDWQPTVTSTTYPIYEDCADVTFNKIRFIAFPSPPTERGK